MPTGDEITHSLADVITAISNRYATRSADYRLRHAMTDDLRAALAPRIDEFGASVMFDALQRIRVSMQQHHPRHLLTSVIIDEARLLKSRIRGLN